MVSMDSQHLTDNYKRSKLCQSKDHEDIATRSDLNRSKRKTWNSHQDDE
jgi:hypothetical protein